MFVKISEQITEKLLTENIISTDNRELYCYGIRNGLILILNLLTVITIGIILNQVISGIIFLLFYTPLRNFAGGYHARTPERCYVFSVILIFAVLLAMKYVSVSSFICIISVNISYIIIALFAPVEDVNKRLDDTEKKVYKKRTVLVIIIEDILCFTAFIFNIDLLLICSFYSSVIAMGLVVSGIVNNIYLNKKV